MAAAYTDRETIARSDDHRALRIWLRLLTCTQMIERVVRSRLREQFATTLPRFDLMAQLERHAEGLKMNELSRLLMVTGGNVTAIVDQLEKEGLVERLPGPAGRRGLPHPRCPGGGRAGGPSASGCPAPASGRSPKWRAPTRNGSSSCSPDLRAASTRIC